MTKSSASRIERRRTKRRSNAVFIGTIEDGSHFTAHPAGGIIVAHPDHPPIWHKPDGSKEEIKP